MDPPSGVVGEGVPLLITCMAPEDASERRFHFYKDGAELIPRDVGSEISTGTGSMNVSVVSIPQGGPKSFAEFTCGYKKNISGRWILSHRSQAVNVTVTAKASPGSIQGMATLHTKPGSHSSTNKSVWDPALGAGQSPNPTVMRVQAPSV